MINFSDLHLSDAIQSRLKEVGYVAPTPVQAQAIPPILEGRDVVACAQTGTGKTASYTLPILDKLTRGRSKARMPRCLILLPTRELAFQVEENVTDYGKNLSLKLSLLIGGVSLIHQERSLAKGPDILIATPGRFLDLYDRGKILLADVKILVIDEADRMLDMGFIPDIKKIVSLLPKQRQTLLLSATMPPEIRALADSLLNVPIEITVTPPTQTADNVKQYIVRVPQDSKDLEYQKRQLLRDLLTSQKVTNAIIFCNRKKDVDTLQRSLTRHKYKVKGLHGDMVQSKRNEALQAFKDGTIDFLIASDIAARGLDVEEMPTVINYDVPHNGEDYIHRIGRTGRAGKAGTAWTLVTSKEHKLLDSIEKTIGNKIMPFEGIAAAKISRPEPKNEGKSFPPSSQKSSPQQAQEKEKEKVKEGEKSKSRSSHDAEPTPKGFGEHIPAFMR